MPLSNLPALNKPPTLTRHTGSSLATSFDNSLLSPASISFAGRATPGSFVGTEGHETSAYIQNAQLWRQYQQRGNELAKTKQELDCLRTAHEKLVESHNLLMATFVQSMKRPRSEDLTAPPDPSGPLSVHVSRQELSTAACSRSDYPDIHYWTKKEWKDFQARNTDLRGKKKGARGATRSSQGENVMMLYIEHPNGMAIDGIMAGQIREFARSIWRGLYERGLAPRKWGDVSREVLNKYFREMEARWPVLRYCDNHWKANTLASSIYPQWYRGYHKKMLAQAKENKEEEQACKKVKIKNEDDIDNGPSTRKLFALSQKADARKGGKVTSK